MPKLEQIPTFFLCANTANGFQSRMEEAYDPQKGWRTFVIKGGPGTGKSTAMRRVAAAALALGYRVQQIPCTGDPDSLDAVILPDQKIMVADGTPPHPLEPRLPGVCEKLVDMGAAFRTEGLQQNRQKIIECVNQNRVLHAAASRYIGAAGALLQEQAKGLEAAVETGKIAAFGAGLAKRYLPKQKGCGSEQIRFLSGVTCQGHLFLCQTVEALCSRVIGIEDAYGLVAPKILEWVRRIALERGYSIISCPCPLFPQRLEHILIPALGLGFCTQNKYLKPVADRRIHARRFLQAGVLRQHKEKITATRRTVKELLGVAVERMAEAKEVHDRLEACYRPWVDFERVDALANQLVADVTQICRG